MSTRNACSIRQGGKGFGTYPAPNAQWSRSIAFGSLLDSSDVNVPPRKRSGRKINLFQDVLLTLNEINEGNVHAYESGYLSSLW